jgi:hypothetical protein
VQSSNDTEAAETATMPQKPLTQKKSHDVVDIEHWIKIFPLENAEAAFQKQLSIPARPVNATEEEMQHWEYLFGDSEHFTKPSGEIIVSPADLALTEQMRRQVGKSRDLGKAVPTDIFLLGVGRPKLPYLTKVGGVPYRPADKPWPTSSDGTPLTFFAQFCFLDSQDLTSSNLPGDVMMVFIRDWDSLSDPKKTDNYCIEWSRVAVPNPVDAAHCPKPRVKIPEYYGVIYRTNDYPASEEVFRQEGHDSYWLLARTQATRIGGDTWFIQYDRDPRRKGESLLCTFNCVYFKGDVRSDVRFPFVNVESSKQLSKEQIDAMQIPMGDCGCIYFLVDAQGNVRWESDSY